MRASLLLVLALGCTIDTRGLVGTPRDGAGGGGPPDGGAGGPGPDGGETCGVCARGCDGGRCGAVRLASGPTTGLSPYTVSAREDAVYYSDHVENAIMRLRKDSAPERLVDAQQPSAVIATATYLFWSNPFGLWRCNLPDCSRQLKVSDDVTSGTVLQFASDDQRLYWVTGPDLTAGRVLGCEAAACTVQEIAVGQHRPHGIAMDAGHVYWTTHGTGGGMDGTIRRIEKGMPANADPTFVPGLRGPSGVASDGLHLYWTEGETEGKLHRCELSTDTCGVPEDITVGAALVATPIHTPKSLVVGLSQLYFTNDGDSTLMSCPIAGCAGNSDGLPALVANGLQMPGGLVATPTCLYWTDRSDGGGVFGVVRPDVSCR